MYLSRLLLDPRSRLVYQDLANCQALHQRVMSAFDTVAGPGRSSLKVLHRVDPRPGSGDPMLLVQSAEAPDWSRLPSSYLQAGSAAANPACRPVDETYAALRAGQVAQFRLRANPTRKIDTASGADGGKRNGRRIDLRREEDQLAWLMRKGEQHGFGVLRVQTRPDRALGQRHGGRLTFGGVVFDGLLVVRDEALFRAALEHGVGSGKAYGFGLLSIAAVGRKEE